MNPPQIGKFKKRITIKRVASTVNANGTTSKVATTVGTYRASVKQITDAEAVASNQQQAHATYEIVMRYQPVYHTDQIVYGDLTLNVQSVDNIEEENRFTKIIATVKV